MSTALPDPNDENWLAAMRKSKPGLAPVFVARDPSTHRNKAVVGTTTNENKKTRAPLGQIGINVPQPKANEMLMPHSESIAKGSFIFPHLKAAAARAGRTRFAVHIDDEDDENKENAVGARVVEKSGSAVVAVDFSNVLDDGLRVAEPTAVRQPLSLLDSYKCESDSPMVLDLSTSASSPCQSADPESTSDAKSSLCEDLCVDVLLMPYAQETYEYLREMEGRCRPKPHYMNKQTDITSGMRSILVDWLVEVASEYNLHQETLQLSVSYVDRFLSHMSVLRGKLQLVGTASMFIASKYEEVHPPDVEEFVYITDDTYTKRQVIRMEHIILKVLGFDLAVPTSLYFLQRFCHTVGTDERTYFLALYLSELTLLEADPYLQFLPSIIAGSSVCLARHTQDLEAWPESLVSFSGYQIDSFKECMDFLFKTFCNAPLYPQQAIREKYKSLKFLEVSSILPPTTQPV